jgi:hypothetical protein
LQCIRLGTICSPDCGCIFVGREEMTKDGYKAWVRAQLKHQERTERRTELVEDEFHEVHLSLPLMRAQGAKHNPFGSCDLLVSHVHQIGKRLKRIRGNEASVTARLG